MKENTSLPESRKRTSKSPQSSRVIGRDVRTHPPKEKFASQGDSKVLSSLRKIAQEEGRQFQSILDEAMRDFLAKKQGQKPRPQVMEAFAASLKDFDDLYRNLAK